MTGLSGSPPVGGTCSSAELLSIHRVHDFKSADGSTSLSVFKTLWGGL